MRQKLSERDCRVVPLPSGREQALRTIFSGLHLTGLPGISLLVFVRLWVIWSQSLHEPLSYLHPVLDKSIHVFNKSQHRKANEKKKKGADVSGFKIDESISISEAIPAIFRVFQRDA